MSAEAKATMIAAGMISWKRKAAAVEKSQRIEGNFIRSCVHSPFGVVNESRGLPFWVSVSSLMPLCEDIRARPTFTSRQKPTI